jgi:S-formylglutathione hydrolase FrmB
MIVTINFLSKELKKNTSVNIILPNNASKNEPFKTIWLLHGLMGDHTSWLRMSSIERYVKNRNVAVVMPNADRSWYTNTAYGINYFNYVAYELPELMRSRFLGYSDKREDNIVAGLSMGGYGALKLALTCPLKYSSCIALSGSLDVTRKGRKYDIDEWRSIFGFDIATPDELEGSEHDLFYLAKRNAEGGLPFPRIYMWCGTEDTLIDINEKYHAHLLSLGVPHLFESSGGDHSWTFWDMHIKDGIKYILDQTNS